jgi:hypothetical protein
MPIIPDYKPVQGDYQPQAPSLGAAMAAGKAVQSVGTSISQVADDLGDYSAQLSRARDAGVKANASLLMQKAFAEHEEFRVQNPDETTWEADIKQRVGTVREKLAAKPMSPFMRAELDATLSGWESNSIHGTKLDGLKQTRARARQHITNAAEAYKVAGDFESARKTLESGRGNAYLPEETDADMLRLDAEEKDFQKEQAHKAALAEIDSDPFSAREKYSSPTPPEGEDATEYQKKRQYHAQRLASEQGNIVDSIRDGIAAGKILRPDQLDEYTDELGASTVATLKNGMEKSADDGRRKMVAMPAYQARMIGAVSSAIDELDPNDIESRVRIEQRLDDIQAGPTKTQLADAISRKLKGEQEDPGPMRRVRTMLNEATRRGYFGPVTPAPVQTTADVVADDFLQDGAKLQGLGFSKDAADSIMDPKLSNEKRLSMFRQLYPSRDAKKATADDYTQRAAAALVNRESTVPKTTGQGAAEFRDAWKALQKKGEIERGLIEWQKDHPDGDVEAELMRRLGDVESSKFLDSVDAGQWFGDEFDTPPTGDPRRPDLPSTTGGSSDALLPPIPNN